MENIELLIREIEDLPELPNVAFNILKKIDDVNIDN